MDRPAGAARQVEILDVEYQENGGVGTLESLVGRRHAQLVSQHLEKISRRVLENYQRIIREYVRGRHGVYALYRKNHLYYVGLASNLRSRLTRHLRDRHAQTWDRFSIYLTIGDEHLKELESLVLRISSPKGNRQQGAFAGSEDIRRRFRRQVAVAQRSELDSLFGVSPAPLTPRKRRATKGRQAVLAQYVGKSLKLRWSHKGTRYVARVRPDGKIRFKGRLFTSPSGAAAAVTRRAMDGWFCWKYQRAPGDWVLLNELRKR